MAKKPTSTQEESKPEEILQSIPLQRLDFSEEYPEFVTPTGAKFERFYHHDFSLFPDALHFDNGTAPFCSRSYSVLEKDEYRILISLSKDSMHILLKNKRSEESNQKTISLEDGLLILAELQLVIPMETLENLGLL